MKSITAIGISILVFVITASPVYAHVTVTPETLSIGSHVITFQVPNERKIPTTELRITVPDNVEVTRIMPVPGWSYTLKRANTGGLTDASANTAVADDHNTDSAGRITEIVWSGGKIGIDEFSEFKMSIKSVRVQDVLFKTYQKYGDGLEVAWDGSSDRSPAPRITFSAPEPKELNKEQLGSGTADAMQSQWLSVGAIIIAVMSIAMVLRKK